MCQNENQSYADCKRGFVYASGFGQGSYFGEDFIRIDISGFYTTAIAVARLCNWYDGNPRAEEGNGLL
jgi:hypothetical protein